MSLSGRLHCSEKVRGRPVTYETWQAVAYEVACHLGEEPWEGHSCPRVTTTDERGATPAAGPGQPESARPRGALQAELS